MYPEITKREILLGIGIFTAVTVISILIASSIRQSWESHYIAIEQALKVTQENEFSYAIKTNVGNILAYGSIKATEPQTYPDIKGQYAIIGRETERYTMHTRVESYSCGKSTCTRVVTYYTWDNVGSDYHKSPAYTVLGKTLNICELKTSRLDLSNYTGGLKRSGDYIYKDGSAWAGVGDIRYYYESVPVETIGNVFLRAFGDRITDPFGKKCIEVHPGQTIEQRVQKSQPHYGTMFVIITIVIIAVVGGYFLAASKEDII